MVYTVYIDAIFAANTVVDMMVLTILNRVLLYRTTKRRILTGTVIGGTQSCAVGLASGILITVEILGTYIAMSSLMAVAAYHLKNSKEVIKPVAGTYLVSMVLGGVILVLCEHTRVGYYAWLLVEVGHGKRIPVVAWFLMIAEVAVVCYGFPGGIKELIRTMTHRKDLYRVTMIYGERKGTVTELIDTGNRLRGLVSSQSVHVAAAGLTKQLCPMIKGMAHVPYQFVGTTSGVLPAVFIDRMEIGQKGGRCSLEKPLVVITKRKLPPSGEYQILIQKNDQGT